jgi:hypothetical protein
LKTRLWLRPAAWFSTLLPNYNDLLARACQAAP